MPRASFLVGALAAARQAPFLGSGRPAALAVAGALVFGTPACASSNGLVSPENASSAPEATRVAEAPAPATRPDAPTEDDPLADAASAQGDGASLHLKLALAEHAEARRLIARGEKRLAERVLLRASADADLALALAGERAAKADAERALEALRAVRTESHLLKLQLVRESKDRAARAISGL